MSEHQPDQTPPPVLLRLVARLLDRHNRDYIIGDLLEAFEADSTLLGRGRANRNLWRELGGTVIWDVMAQARDGVRMLLGCAPERVAAVGAVIAQRPNARLRRAVGMALLLGATVPLLYILSGAGVDQGPRFHLQSLGGEHSAVTNTGADFAESAILVKLVAVQGWSTREAPILAMVSAAAAQAPGDATVLRGRAFGMGDDAPNVDVAVLMESAWRNRLASTEDVIGSTLIVDGRAVKIIGVVAMDFDWPGPEPQLWMARPPAEIARLGAF